MPAQDMKARRKRRNSTQREMSLESSQSNSSMVVDDVQVQVLSFGLNYFLVVTGARWLA